MMALYDFDFDEERDLEVGDRGFDTERQCVVTFVKWANEDHDLVMVEDEHDEPYITYTEEIDWDFDNLPTYDGDIIIGFDEDGELDITVI